MSSNHHTGPQLPRETLGLFESHGGEYIHIPELDDPIVLPDLPFSTDPWSPTPLDPHYLSTTDRLHYYHAALELMLDRFERRMAETDLDPASQDLIRKEIEMFHQKRCLKNTEAMDRLRSAARQNPELLTPDIRGSIFRARSAQATLMDNLELLATFPKMGSIGGIQATEPFNIPVMNSIASQNKKNIIQELWERGIDFTILNADTKYKSPAPRNLSPTSLNMGQNIESLSEAIALYAQMKDKVEALPFVIAEKPVVEIRYKGKRIEMVEGMNPFVSPAHTQLQNVTPNEVFIPTKGPVNLQNISYMTFFRVIPDEEPGEMLFVEARARDDSETELVG